MHLLFGFSELFFPDLASFFFAVVNCLVLLPCLPELLLRLGISRFKSDFGALKPIKGGRVPMEISSAQDHDFDDFLARQAGV